MTNTIPEELNKLRRQPDHPLRGTLFLESSKRANSHRLTDRYEVIQGAIPDISIQILSVLNDLPTRAMFMAYHYSIFSLNPGDVSPNKMDLAASMIGLLFNTIDYTRILTFNNELTGHCVKAGFRPIFRIITEQT